MNAINPFKRLGAPSTGGALLVAFALGFSATPTLAETTDKSVAKSAQVDRLNEAGAGHYARREYRQAIALFSKALAIDPDPNLLFNIARCHERLGDTQAAIDNYELFLSTPGADAQGRARAQSTLKALRSSLAASPATEPAVVVTVAEPGSTGSGNSGATAEAIPILPWATLGGGAFLMVTGATFYALGISDHGKVTKADGFGQADQVVDMDQAQAQAFVDSGDNKKLFGSLALGVGGALLATYAVLLTRESSAAEPSDVAFSVLPSAEGAALFLQGSF